MARKYLIDTNAIIEYLGDVLPQEALTLLDGIIDRQFYISVINKIELLGFTGITESEEQKFLEFIEHAHVLHLSEDIVNSTIELRKQNRIKIPDAIIAATAIVHQLTIVTRNAKDFVNINGLKVLNPYDNE